MTRLPLDPEALAQLCRRHRIRRLSLFGSVLQGTARPDSDVDFLVEFEPGAVPGLLGLAAIETELSGLLGGRHVDLRTAKELSRYFREEVLGTAEVQYAA
jgi:predicted nucleotidyltransferase